MDHFKRHDAVASFVSVKPNLRYHVVSLNGHDQVSDIRDLKLSDIRINGGYFIFKQDIFKYLKAGEELVHEPFRRLVDQKKLVAYQYDGFWASMDTFKDKQHLDDLYAKGNAPWQVWGQWLAE